MTTNKKIIWITGGSAGIGFEIAKTAVELGYHAVLSARNEAGLRTACEQLGKDRASYYVLDVTDRTAVNDTVSEIIGQHGCIDVLVNNAGFNVVKRKWDELIPDEFDSVISANLTGTFNAIYSTLPHMRSRQSGLIINMASLAGRSISLDGGLAYSVAKHGVYVMSEMLNQSEVKNGIRTCVIAPGGVKTRAHDWRPEMVRNLMLDPAEIARAVRFVLEAPEDVLIFEIPVTSTAPYKL